MIWIFRALMAAGFVIFVMSIALAVLIYVNFDPATCGENCDGQTRFVLLTPSLVLGIVGLITVFVSRRLTQRLKLAQQASGQS